MKLNLTRTMLIVNIKRALVPSSSELSEFRKSPTHLERKKSQKKADIFKLKRFNARLQMNVATKLLKN